MSGYSRPTVGPGLEQDQPWGKEETFFLDEGNFTYSQDELNFQTYEQSNQYPMQTAGSGYGNMAPNPMLNPTQMQYTEGDMFSSSISALDRPPHLSQHTGEEEDEPPLLEELGIDPDRIVEKTLTVLNPFRRKGPTDDVNFLVSDTDLAAPLVFCLALGACLLFSGKVNFGYVYGLAVISWLVMYCLLSLMASTAATVTLMSVASVLGYCILPVVGLSAFGIFISLRSGIGLVLSFISIAWCSLSASRLFVTMLCEDGQRPLIAYPCALLYSVFAIVTVF